MMQINTLIILLLVLVNLAACRSPEAVSEISFFPDTTAATKLETQRKIDTVDLSDLRKVADALHIPDLSHSVDRQVFRLWLFRAGSDIATVVGFLKINGKWSSEVYYVKIYAEGHRLDSVSYNKAIVTPRSGWNHFFKQFYTLKIDKLKAWQDIPGYSLDTGGSVIHLEFAEGANYRLISFPSIETQEGLEEVDNLKRFLKLVEDEFGYNHFTKHLVPIV